MPIAALDAGASTSDTAARKPLGAESIVRVEVFYESGAPAYGTGFVVSSDCVVAAWHVLFLDPKTGARRQPTLVLVDDQVVAPRGACVEEDIVLLRAAEPLAAPPLALLAEVSPQQLVGWSAAGRLSYVGFSGTAQRRESARKLQVEAGHIPEDADEQALRAFLPIGVREGMSGSPLLVARGATALVAGLVVRGGRGRPITEVTCARPIIGLLEAEGIAHSVVRELGSEPRALRAEACTPTGLATLRDWRRLAERTEIELRQLDLDAGFAEEHTVALTAEVDLPGRTPGARRIARRVSDVPGTLLRQRSRLALLEGDPGSGKSVCLRHVARRLASLAGTSKLSRRRMPLYLRLAELTLEPDVAPTGASIAHWVRDAARAWIGRHGGSPIDVDAALAEGLWFILLDGFDEIPAVLAATHANSVVRAYSEAIREFAHSNHGCQVLVASRAYLGPGRVVWPRYRLRALDGRQRSAIIRSWFPAGGPYRRVLSELVTSRSIEAWVDNPMVLNLICAHRKNTGKLPASVHAAFESFVSRRMDERPECWEHRFDRQELVSCAERLSMALLELESEPGAAAPPPALSAALERAATCLVELRLARGQRSRAQDRRRFEFVHRRLHEYFAASHLLRSPEAVDPERLLTDNRFREVAVVLLHFGSDAQLRPTLRWAAEHVEAAVLDLKTSFPEFEHRRIPDNARDLERAQRRQRPMPFPWPSHTAHVLGILHSVGPDAFASLPALAAELERSRRAAGQLLLMVLLFGTRSDQIRALEVAASADRAVLALIVDWALFTKSEVLQDAAFDRASHLTTFTPELHLALGRLLVVSEISGEIARDPTRLSARIRRFAAPDELLSKLRRLALLRSFDRWCWALVLAPVGLGIAIEVFRNGPRAALQLFGGFASGLLTGLSVDLGWGQAALGGLGAVFIVIIIVLYLQLERALWQRVVEMRRRVGGTTLWLCALATQVVRANLVNRVLILGVVGWFSPPVLALMGLAELGLTFRPGSYFAAYNGRFQGRSWWFASLSTLLTWQVVVGAGLFFTLTPALPHLLPRLETVAGYMLLEFGVVAALLALGLRAALVAHDRLSFAGFKRIEELEVEDLITRLLPRHIDRLARIRLVRNDQRLIRSVHGRRFLSDTIGAIERDYLEGSTRRWPLARRQPDSSWSSEFRTWYVEHAPRSGLGAWYGDTLDELVRLRAQLDSPVASHAEHGRDVSAVPVPSSPEPPRRQFIWQGTALWVVIVTILLAFTDGLRVRLWTFHVCGPGNGWPTAEPTRREFICQRLGRKGIVDVHLNMGIAGASVPDAIAQRSELSLSAPLRNEPDSAIGFSELKLDERGISARYAIGDERGPLWIPWDAVDRATDEAGRGFEWSGPVPMPIERKHPAMPNPPAVLTPRPDAGLAIDGDLE